MQITESIVAQISRKTFNQMFDPALRRSKVLMSGNGSSVNWAENAGHATSADTAASASAAPWSGITDKPDVAIQAAHNNLLAARNEFTFASSGFSGDIWLNYRTAGGLNGAITGYTLGDGAGNALGTIIHSGNIGSQSVSYATSAGDADTVDGLHVASGRADSANVIVRTDSSGYLNCGWINTTSGGFYTDESISRVYCSNDGYLRYLSPSDFISKMSILPLSGGTMTGGITCKANQYYGDSAYGINMNNSDLIGCNSIRFEDNSNDYTEAIMFPNDAKTSWDSFRATGGTFWWQYDNGNNLAKLNTNGFYLYSGLMRITNNSRTVTIGAQNSGAIHIYNDNSSPFFFNGDVSSNASKTYDLGSTTYPWGTLYAAGGAFYDTTPSVHVGTSSSARISLHWSGDSNRGLYDYTGNWVVATNGTNTFMMKGNVGIGTTAPAYKFDVNGVIYSNTGVYSAGYVTALSDARKKDVLGDVELSAEQIAEMPAVRFSWTDKTKPGIFIGTLAQPWQKLLPEAVRTMADGVLSFDYQSAAMVSVINLAREVAAIKSKLKRYGFK